MLTDRSLRLLRGLTVAVAGVALPVAGHWMAGGPVAISMSTAFVALVVAGVTTSASSREWTLVRIVAVLVPVQALVHVTLTAGGGGHAEHVTPGAGTADAGMVLAHVLALAMLIVWLRLAERALLRLLALADRLFCRLTVPPLPVTPFVPCGAMAHELVSLRGTRTVRSRAPPALSFV